MAKQGIPATTIKEAIARWEERNPGEKASEAKCVKLYAQITPIEKMDQALAQLKECEQLSLSTNCIEKIANLSSLKNLKILSLSRNQLKSLVGLEALQDTLTQLWLSYNLVDKLKGVQLLRRLEVLYLSHNRIKDAKELDKLKELERLVELNLIGNPCREAVTENSGDEQWRARIQTLLPRLRKLDNRPLLALGTATTSGEETLD